MSLTELKHKLKTLFAPTDVAGISRTTYSLLLVLLFIAMLWLFTAPLASAVIIPGNVKVFKNRLVLQHPEGGRIEAVHVKEGDVVDEDHVILSLSNPQLASTVRGLERQIYSESLRVMRLRAEMVYPNGAFTLDELPEDAEHKSIAQTELNLFQARARNVASQELLLRQQVAHVYSEIAALRRSLANDVQMLERTRNLEVQGFVSPVNVINAEQSINQRQAELARAQQRVAELEQRLPVLLEDFRNNAALEYRQARERLLDAEERLRPAVEALNNLMVRSPTGGTVVNLTRLGIGAVLGAKETVAELVPLERGLILEGSLPTEQVAFLSPGMPARVRIQQLSKIGYDELMGVIETISADTISQGMLGTAVYIVQVDLGQLPPDIEAVMRPGMPVEIYIQTGTRTPFQYLSEPITSFLNRAARE